MYCPNLYRLSVSGARVAALSAAAALAAVFPPHQLHGQARDIAVSTGAITGAVRDSSGARRRSIDRRDDAPHRK
jgi:hypothetical protein